MLIDFMWRRKLEGILSLRPEKDRCSMSLEALVFPKALMREASGVSNLQSVS